MTLKTARESAGLTQRELATAANVDGSLISLIETGRRPLATSSYARVVRISRVLGVKPERMVSDRELAL